MPSLYTAANMVFAAFQANFATSTWPVANWFLTVGDEAVADADAFTDQCCQGLGVMMVPAAGLEVGTSQKTGGSLYLRQTVHLWVFRCAPTMGNDLRAPTSAEHDLYTQRSLDDSERMFKTVWTVAGFDWITEQDISDPTWEAVPVSGGCGGGSVTFEMAVIGDCP